MKPSSSNTREEHSPNTGEKCPKCTGTGTLCDNYKKDAKKWCWECPLCNGSGITKPSQQETISSGEYEGKKITVVCTGCGEKHYLYPNEWGEISTTWFHTCQPPKSSKNPIEHSNICMSVGGDCICKSSKSSGVHKYIDAKSYSKGWDDSLMNLKIIVESCHYKEAGTYDFDCIAEKVLELLK